MTLKQALESIACNDWNMSNSERYNVWECPGEMADGVPDWVVYDRGGRGWLSREIGWYYQRGDWDGYSELVRVAKAMDAADEGLQAVLQEEPR